MTRITGLFIALLILVLILSACVFHPVVPQADFDATVTARSQLAALSDTPEPPLPTIEPVVAPEETVATLDCEIKVNRSANGELIYHLPGQPTYNATKVDPDKDEFYACDEQSAIDAGARKALR